MGLRVHGAVMRFWAWGIGLAGRVFGHEKAKSWSAARSPSARTALQAWAANRPARSVTWFHCASLGEYEQARPVMAAYRAAAAPDEAVLLTFFSPSGFDPVSQRKPPGWRSDHDHLAALPPDHFGAVRPFLASLRRPDGQMVVRGFVTVKYEVWPVLLRELKRAAVPSAIVAAHLPSGHWLTRPYGRWHRAAWRNFAALLVQTPDTVTTLNALDIPGAIPAGDPRADRVLEIAEQATPPAALLAWKGNQACVIGGSTWPPEERALVRVPAAVVPRLILVPHALDANHLEAIRTMLRSAHRPFVMASDLGGVADMTDPGPEVEVIVVDEMGMLARLYAVADLAIVGGGWGAGIHNVLEPSAHGLPVLTGPKIQRFREALDLRSCGALRTAHAPDELPAMIAEWLENISERQASGDAARAYVAANRGAASTIAVQLRKTFRP